MKKVKEPLAWQYIAYFNKCRNAGISQILGKEGHIVVHYEDGRKIPIPHDILKWTALFDWLDKTHPALPRHSDTPAQERRAGTPSKRV